MTDQRLNIVDFSKHYLIDEEGFLCFVNDAGERTRIARILRNGNIETVGKTRISDPSAQKKRHFLVKTFLFLFFMLAVCSAGIIFYIYEKSAKLNEEYLAMSVKYSDAVSEVVLGCRSELKKIEHFINDSDNHSEEEIDELIRKLKSISPNYCQSNPDLYPKFSELSKALYVMKGKITGKHEAEEKQKKELEQQQELERQREIERQQQHEQQQEAEEQREAERQKKLEREIAEMKQREADRKKNEDKALKIGREKRQKEAKEKKNNRKKDKTKSTETTKNANNSVKKKNGDGKNAVKGAQIVSPPGTQKENDEETSRLKRGIDKLEEWLKNLSR